MKNIRIILLLGFSLMGFWLGAQVSPEEKAALFDLYNATDGPNWSVESYEAWNFSEPVTSLWHGVRLYSSGHVVELTLDNSILNGSIPESIGDLSYLTHLDLSDNELSGNIPERIGDLSNLTDLDLTDNELSGNIPERIGDLSNLTDLDLSYNYFSGSIPERIGDLSNLTDLNLSDNYFSGSIPERIGDLSNLTDLDLSNNRFSENIPERIGDLSNLTDLDISDNELSGNIPERIGDLSNLTDLDLSNNELSGNIPERIGDLSNLTDLDLANNQLESIPERIGDLSNLTDLDLANNQLESIPERIGDLSNLTDLNLSDNELTNNILETIENLTQLEDIDLSGNKLTGNIFSSLFNLTELSSLWVTNNNLSGTIPSWIYKLSSVNLSENQLSGSLPEVEEISSPLYVLSLDNNLLSGNIPESMNSLNNIKHLFLNDNLLEGPVLPGLEFSQNLSHLHLRGNKFNFEDLIPINVDKIGVFTYETQSKVDQAETILENTTSIITLTTTENTSQNHYKWFKDGSEIVGAADSPNYVINNAQLSDSGTYYCEITNDILTDLTLTRNNIQISVTEQGSNTNPGGPGEIADTDWNTTTSWQIGLDGTIRSSARTYFDELGKPVQSQSWDVLNNTIWGQETLYDYQGRAALSTLSAPISGQYSFQHKAAFITDSNGNGYEMADFDNDDPFSPSKVNINGDLGKYYQGVTSDVYQDITSYPFSRIIYSELNPGKVLAGIGGNKVDTDGDGTISDSDKWVTSHSFSMPAAQELSQLNAFADNTYDAIKTIKTISRGAEGFENVVFTNTDGQVLAAARSGLKTDGSQSENSISLNIPAQGFIDIHIPIGCSGVTLSDGPTDGVIRSIDVYDLTTDKKHLQSLSELDSGFYRVAVDDGSYDGSEPYVLTHDVNYYDYSLNEYDETGRLTVAHQPLTNIDGVKLKTIYEYNTLGQLITVESPDEGKATFKYRKDGQIRYSQSELQADDTDDQLTEYSYTDYDDLGRPIQSGVAYYNRLTNRYFIAFDELDPDGELDTGVGFKEVQETFYDFIPVDVDLTTILPDAYQSPSFLSGNVVMTKNNQTTTYYSYDIYGRVTWIAQDIMDLGIKTIDYEYDPISGVVTRVLYQKDESDRFIHRYSYNTNNQLTKVEISTEDIIYLLQAEYFYDQAGTLVRQEIADGAQGLDYVYNMAGQLKSINHPSLSANNDPRRDGQPGDSNDLFGMQIDYHVGDYQRTTNANITTSSYGTDNLNGNIKGVRWNNANPNIQESEYTYTYDRNNWLINADFDPKNTTTSGVNLLSHDSSNDQYNNGEADILEASESYTLTNGFHAKEGSDVLVRITPNTGEISTGDYDVSNITYDANGNIKTLARNKGNESGNNVMDELTYHYKDDKPNQLLQVADAKGDVTGADDIGDQIEAENYVYNAIGQLIHNKEEKIDYFYNTSGLVTEVKQNSQTAVKFFYNDRNHRVKKESYTNGSLSSTTFYVRDAAGQTMAIYSGLSNNVALVEQPIYGAGRIGVAYTSSTNTKSYSYELTDHLGNVRAVFTKEGAANGSVAGSSDFYPFGMPMPNRNVVGDYRYAFQGQEKDGETGKEAFELRLWDSRIGRWLTTDPYGQYSSPYLGMGNNPISRLDPDGGMDCDPCPHLGGQLDEVVVTARRSSWSSEGMYWNTSFQGDLNDWNALNNTSFSNSNDAFDWYKQQEWNGIASQHKAEYYAGLSSKAKGVGMIIGTATLPVTFLVGAPLILEAGSGLAWNQGRQIVYDGGANLIGQYVTNGGDFKKIDYFDVAASGLLKANYSSLILQSGINANVDGIRFNEDFIKDLTTKAAIKNVHGQLNIPNNTWLGDRGIFRGFNFLSKSAVSTGAMGASSQIEY